MSNSLYALAQQLEQAIRTSEDFQQLKRAYEAVRRDETAYRMFTNFRQLQMQLHEKQFTGSAISSEEVEQAQKAMAIAQQNEKLSALMALEQRMSMMIADINQIAMRPLEELYRSFTE
ncbi:YlbF family regulator [Anoxybacteroides tepidamans]|uniref:YlbF family regulator n=1 Tax=Anoxybacteroides tepidamans TaxID=265948 RepID=UPI000480F30C|nr:YlbF family regulator [Anoxybacillus tepidamans]